jgi:1-acyl-sn-glycerol-3-phosphate acyltransferase
VSIDRLERLWRSFGVGLFLALIGLGGTLMALTVFPLLFLTISDRIKRQRAFQFVLHCSFKLCCFGIKRLRIADLQIVGAQRLASLRGVLIVANHPSLLDVVLIMSIAPRVQCIVKAALWRNPFFRLTLSGADYIRNDLAPEQLLDACRQTLAAGNNLIVFPEGTRTIPGQAPKLQRGFANIAAFAEADLQLITFTCDPPQLFKGNPWWDVPRRRSCLTMEIGERLNITDFLRSRSRPLAARKLVAFLNSYYSEKLGYEPIGTGAEAADRLGAEA